MEKIYAYSNKAGRHTVNYHQIFISVFAYGSCSGNFTGSSDDLESVCYDSGNDASGIFNAGLWLDYTCIWIFRWHLNIDAPVKNTVGTKMIWAIMGIGSLKSVEYLI